MAMNATSLQTTLGLGALPLDPRDTIEVGLALIAILVAFALRRRTMMVRALGFALIAAALLADLALPIAADAPRIAAWIEAIALMLFWWGAIKLVCDLVDGLIRRRRAHFSTIVRDIVLVTAYSVVAFAILHAEVQFELTSILATSAVFSVVLGFGLQETLGNIFHGFSLKLQEPFKPGDWVKFGERVGQVQGLGWRTTRIVTRANERLEVPNSLIAKDVLTNFATGNVADEVSIGLPYSEPPNRVKEVIARVLRHMPEVLLSPTPEILAWEYGESAIKYRIKYWLRDYGPQERVRDEVVSALWYALKRHSIDIPFPIRTVFMHEVQPQQEVQHKLEEAVLSEIREVDFLKALSDDELRVLTASARVHQFGRGEYLMHEGDQGDTFYILRRGTAEVFKNGINGSTIHLTDYKPGAFTGEMSVMTGEPRTASIRATSDIEVLEIKRDGFTQLFKARPEVAVEIGHVIEAREEENRRTMAAAAHSGAGETQGRGWLVPRMRRFFDI